MTEREIENYEIEAYLRAHGWRTKRESHTSWCWYHPRYPSVFYKLNDAYDIAVAAAKGRM